MSIISELAGTIEFSHQIDKDVRAFFEYHDSPNIAVHTETVVENVLKLAKQFNVNADLPVTAAFLHDLGWVLPIEQVIPAALEFGFEVLEEERQAPGLLHQKLSKAIAGELFGIKNSVILNAVECHTTLKAQASDIELILFVADKLTWDMQDSKPIVTGILEGLGKSLAHAAFSYIKYTVENRETMRVLHPRMLEAYDSLKQICT